MQRSFHLTSSLPTDRWLACLFISFRPVSSLTVTTVPGYDRAELDAAVRAAVTAALEPLASPPRLKTRLKERDSS